MPDPQTIELIHRRLDDEIEPAERAELELRLAADPEARDMSNELGAMNELLAGIPLIEPPAGLVTGVMERVRREPTHGAAPFLDRRARQERNRTRAVRFGLGLAAALAICFFMVPSLRETIDPRHVSGTMIGQPESSRTIASEIPIRGENFSGTIRVTAGAESVVLAIAFDSAADREVRVEFDPEILSLESPASVGTAAAEPAASGSRNFDLRDAATELQFTRRTGQASNIALTIRQGDGTAFETTVNLGQSTNF